LGQASRIQNQQMLTDAHLYAEFWTSLASLLRTYTAAHGLHGNRQASIEAEKEKITVRHGKKWLRLERSNAIVTWTRENGISGTMQLTEHGRLLGPEGEEEMDLAAEAWARDLMQDQDRHHATESTR
jgi:hypothetical protein